MSNFRRVAAFMLSVAPVVAQTAPQQAKPAPPVVTPAPAVRTLPPVPMQPAVIATPAPASGSATPAAVDYAGGKLTVVADNAPLGFVLKLIGAKTGAVIDLVPELQNEPVVARLGPASVRDVMSALLDSPRIDYIVLGAGDETGGLQRVVVRMRHSTGLFAMSAPRQAQPKQEEAEAETPDQNVHPAFNGRMPSEAQQRMLNWQRSREAMRATEIKQQAQERENDRNGSPDPPAPPQDNPPDPPQNQTENPPQL